MVKAQEHVFEQFQENLIPFPDFSQARSKLIQFYYGSKSVAVLRIESTLYVKSSGKHCGNDEWK